jgi:hypothetical protein
MAPERMGESVAVVEAAGRSGVAPETAGPKHAAPEQGSVDNVFWYTKHVHYTLVWI